LSTAAATNGSRTPWSPSTPPIAGPAMKPSPKHAPMRPNQRARWCSGVRSAMAADATAMLAPVMPAMARPTNSIHSEGAKAMKSASTAAPSTESSSTGRRPKRSLSAPSTGAQTNCISA
jgi:hypothetical protein